MEVRHPDTFLFLQLGLDREKVKRVILKQAADTGRKAPHPASSPAELLDLLTRCQVPEFAREMRKTLGLL